MNTGGSEITRDQISRVEGIGGFRDRVAFVTGGGSGIGAAVSKRLAEAGARAAIVDFDLHAAERVAAEVRTAGGQALALKADVSDAVAVESAVRETVRRFGALHLGVNNAGVPAPAHAVGEIPLNDWHRVIAIDLTGVFLSMRFQIPAMLESGGGAIVNLASILGLNGMAARAPYVAAKHGVVGLTKAAALDYAQRGIRVNAVAPGYVDTPLLADRDSATRQRLAGLHPMNRLATADEIAQVILFLLSDRAAFVTGQTYSVDGGYSAQ